MAAGASIASTDFYRREARRLRYGLRDDPAKLHRSLQALSQWHNVAMPAPVVWTRETRTDHVQDLIAAVAQNMEGPILRYPARVALLKRAQRAGLGHFDANLIITAAQHRMGERIERTPRRTHPRMHSLGIALILQAWILVGLYWLLVA